MNEELIKRLEGLSKSFGRPPCNLSRTLAEAAEALRQSEPVNTKDRDEGFEEWLIPYVEKCKLALHSVSQREVWNAAYDFALRRTEKEQAVLTYAKQYAEAVDSTLTNDPTDDFEIDRIRSFLSAVAYKAYSRFSAYPPDSSTNKKSPTEVED